MTTEKLCRRQTCWAKFLEEFNFVISYTLGRKNGKTDLFSCQLNE